MKHLYLIVLLALTASLAHAQNFTKITSSVASNSFTSWGITWVDYDGDGDLDAFINDKDQHRLFRNDGGDVFTNVTPANLASPAPLGFYYTTAWGDYNNDGNIDAYMGNDGDKNALFMGTGPGAFTQVTTGQQVTDQFHTFANVSWVDYNNDGFLDIFCSNVQNTSGSNEKNNLYKNNGGTSFTKITAGEIVNDLADNWCHAWADYNNDRCPDLFVGNMSNDFLYKNNCDGTFTKVATGPQASDGQDTESASWGDYDNDGDLDLFVGIWGNPCRLYRNNGDGTFTKVNGTPLDNNTDQVTSSGWGDYDNDGFLDLYVCCWVSTGGTHNRLYHNDGAGVFAEVTGSVLTTASHASNGCLWADYDSDGDLDLYVSNKATANELFRNDGNGRSWMKFTCVGTASNRSGIGVKVRAKAMIDGTPVWQLREIGGVSGQLAQNPLCASFGFYNAAVLDSVLVEWPSGTTCAFTNVPVNQSLVVKESECSATPMAVHHAAPGTSFGLYASPNPFSSAVSIAYDLAAQADVQIRITDAAGRLVFSLHHAVQVAGHYETMIPAERFPAAGTYFYTVSAGAAQQSGIVQFTGK